jgi:autotransporter-associated beta strand protein
MTFKLRFRASRFLFTVFAAFLVSAGVANAQTWISPTSGNWSNPANWTPGVPTSGPTTSLVFTASGSSGYTASNDLGNPFQVNSLTFQNSSTGFLNINNPGSNQIQLTGATPTITLAGTGTAQIIPGSGSSIALNATSGMVTVTGGGTGNFTLGALSGAGQALRINAAAPSANTQLIGTAGGTFDGGVIFDSGNLQTSVNLGAGPVTVNGGTLSIIGNNFITNAFTLNSNLVFQSTTSTPTIAGVMSGPGGLRLQGQSGTGGLNLAVPHAFTGNITLDSAPMMAQNLFDPVNPGTLTVHLTGSVGNAGNIHVRSGGIFTVDDTNNGGTNRVNNNSSLILNGGTFNFTVGNTVNNEVLNTLVVDGGHNGVLVSGTSASRATFAGITRSNRGTIFFMGPVTLTTPPPLVGGGGAAGSTNISIIPYAIGATTVYTLATHDASGVRGLGFTEFASNFIGIAGTTTQTNVRLTAGENLNTAATTTINGLVLNSVTLSNSLGGALTVSSGAILFSASTGTGTINANLNFGTSEAVISTVLAAGVINGNISGSGGLTKAGGGTLTLSGMNTYTGITAINGGTLNISSAAALGGSTSLITGGANANVAGFTNIKRAGLTYTGSAPITLNQDISITSGLFEVAVSNAAASLTLPGSISGSGGLMVNSFGNVILTNNSNSYTGHTRVYFGNLVLSNDAQLGNGGGVELCSSPTTGILLAGHWTTSRHINVSFDSQVHTNGFNATWNGLLSGPSALFKEGAGKLNIAGSSSAYTGAVTVRAGRLNVDGVLATSANAVTVNAGAVLGGAGTVNRSVTVAGTLTAADAGTTGILSISNNVSLNVGSIFFVDLQGDTPGAGYDQVALTATTSTYALATTGAGVTLAGTRLNGFLPDFLDAFVILDNNNPTANSGTGTFAGLPDGSFFVLDGTTFQIRYNVGTFSVDATNGLVTLTPGGSIVIAAVPEPTTIALLCGGTALAAYAYLRRRRQATLVENLEVDDECAI